MGMDLDAFCDVNDEKHHVYDLGTPDDCPHKGGMARAVHQRNLERIRLQALVSRRQRCGEGRKAQVQCDASFLALGMLVQSSGGQLCRQCSNCTHFLFNELSLFGCWSDIQQFSRVTHV